MQLVHEVRCLFDESEYLIEVFCRPDGSHFARTIFSSQDVIISDGISLDDVLFKHQDLLPLAVRSRQLDLSARLTN